MKNNFLGYIKNRFSPLQFIPIILIFYLSFHLFSEISEKTITISLETLIGFIIVYLIFFHIRLLDDIKDYKKTDPYKKTILKKYLIIVILLEIILAILLGLNSLLFYTAILLLSIGIFYDFFIKKILTKNILINNFTHQLIIIILGLFIFIINNKEILKINYTYLLFTFNMYLIFAFFEFTRKIKNIKDKDYKKSYNYMFGKKKFSLLIILLTFLTGSLTIFTFLKSIYIPAIIIIEGFIAIFTIVLTLYYLKKHIKEKTLKKICFLYLLLTLLFIIFTNIILKNIIFKTGFLVTI